jgi:uncharacterized protein Smg (DUF494 family)
MKDYVFQMKLLLDPYRVTPSIELENLNFYITKNTYIDVDIDKLNEILSNIGYKKVDDEINLIFNEENDDGHENDKK